jgi:hypothetical protein
MTRVGVRSARFGDVVVIAFLIEANPLLAWLMAALGCGGGVAAAKVVAGGFGIALHLIAVHRVLAALAVFYLAVAVVPWIGVLLF